MQSDQKGFGVIEILIVVVVVALIGAAGWLIYDRRSNKTDNRTASYANSQKQETQNQEAESDDPYEGWQEVTFIPENLKVKLPPTVKAASTVELNTEGTATVINLESGFSFYVTLLGNPKTDNSYGNTEKSTAYDNFTSGAQEYYITNSGISLDVSTCQAQVCALQSRLHAERSVLVQVYYHNPGETDQQAPDLIPVDDAYIATIEQTLKSLSY